MLNWAAFLYLGSIAWGTSFLWIKVALEELGPATLTTYRFLFGLITILLITAIARRKIELRGITFWMPLAIGVLNAATPIMLISWAETRIDSGLAGVLNSTMPIWTLLIAHFVLHDDKLSWLRGLGLTLGFGGVFILMSPNASATPDIWGQLAVLTAAVLYAVSTVMTRRFLNGVHPLQTSVVAMTSAFVTCFVVATLFEGPFAVPREPMTWLAVSWMGIIGMGLAVQVWFYLINNWGATKTSMVTYVFPPSAVALGVIFLGEPLTMELLVGGALIIGGIILVNRPISKKNNNSQISTEPS